MLSKGTVRLLVVLAVAYWGLAAAQMVFSYRATYDASLTMAGQMKAQQENYESSKAGKKFEADGSRRWVVVFGAIDDKDRQHASEEAETAVWNCGLMWLGGFVAILAIVFGFVWVRAGYRDSK